MSGRVVQLGRKLNRLYDLLEEATEDASELGDDDLVEWLEEAISSIDSAREKVQAA